MTDRISTLRQRIVAKQHQQALQTLDEPLAGDFKRLGLTAQERMVRRLEFLMAAEKPCLEADERIVFTRTIRSQPEIFTPDEWEQIRASHYIHELGFVSNVTPNYYDLIRDGFAKRRRDIQDALRDARPEDRPFLDGQLRVMQAVGGLAARYREQARQLGNDDVAAVLEHVPEQGARTFHEALQFFRILHFTLWLEGEYHNTIGRFDRHMIGYLEQDLASGRLDEDEAFELLEEFFLSFNKDSNLYPGVQQGDNGQSMVLGGRDPQGTTVFNRLTRMCLEASRELKLIDPKINLRVDRGTPLETYRMGTELTREGLGFPQYSNDDVVIPGLIALGYDPADAADYSVAACWEFIIPGKGMDVANIGAVSFPHIIDESMREDLPGAASFDAFLEQVGRRVGDVCRSIVRSCANLWFIPAPFLSLLTDSSLARRQDVSLGARYNNWGLHGTGIATAVDSLASIRQYIYEEGTLTPAELIDAVDQDFAGYAALLHQLRYESPKFGDGNETSETLATWLLGQFADAVKDLHNERGGRIRAGTGTAMYYLWHVRDLPASPDGRRKGEPLAANYTPSLFARVPGPLSIIQSFTRPDLTRVINGGPLTLEFHDTLFRTQESRDKVSTLVKWYIDRGGHQLQLNAVNRDVLLDARAHPEQHRQLIVRVWGWSAYFCELDEAYQDHVLRRTAYDSVG
ncbi:MAG: pyruvate formate-lyase [Clostridiaceae bacterium]|nr:pyruvate formate-lyase [Clostridiaceae bacterium]